jgi:hypothetical protein
MAANDTEFGGTTGDTNLAFAQGWNPSTRSARGGISFPQQVKIRPGEVLIRIGHSVDAAGNPVPDWVNLTSPWWMTSSTFLEIGGRSEDSGTAIDHMVRIKLALTPDFGVADTLFWVIVRQTLRAWNGRGFPVMEDPDPAVREKQGVPLAWHGGYEISQNFIPGLRDFAAWKPSPVALASFDVLPKMPLSAWGSLHDGGFAPIPFPMP